MSKKKVLVASTAQRKGSRHGTRIVMQRDRDGIKLASFPAPAFGQESMPLLTPKL